MDSVRMKDIEGYEGRYAVSDGGDIWCYPNKSNKRVPANGLFKKLSIRMKRDCGREKKPYKVVTVGLSKRGNATTHTVARLVAKAFIPNNRSGMVVNHINGDSTDNRVENLEWITAKENTQHAHRSGLVQQHTPAQIEARKRNGKATATKNNRMKRLLTDSQVAEVRRLLDNKSMRQIGKQFGVSGKTIANIRDGKTYTD